MKCKNPALCNEIRLARKKTQEKYCSIWQKKLEQYLIDLENGKAKLYFDKHFQKRSIERVLNQKQLFSIIQNGEVIEQNKNSGNIVRVIVFSYVKIGKSNYRPMHVVLEVITPNEWCVITTYSPKSHSWKWSEYYDEKICFCKYEGESVYE